MTAPRLPRRTLLAGALATIGAATSAATARAQPAAELWDRWTRHGESMDEPDDRGWAEFLSRYRVMGADGVARVRYGAVTPVDRAALDAACRALMATEVDALARPAQFAFWCNLYNALTVRLIVENWPVASIRDLKDGLFSFGPWGRKLARVGGEDLSLDDIEHRILRPIWRDPRIHYAVNCASVGCPDLPATPFRAATLEAQLQAAARAYVNHPRGARVEDRDRLIVSSIYHWYAGDFGQADAAIIAHLSTYAAPRLAGELAPLREIADHAYDWSINAAP